MHAKVASSEADNLRVPPRALNKLHKRLAAKRALRVPRGRCVGMEMRRCTMRRRWAAAKLVQAVRRPFTSPRACRSPVDGRGQLLLSSDTATARSLHTWIPSDMKGRELSAVAASLLLSYVLLNVNGNVLCPESPFQLDQELRANPGTHDTATLHPMPNDTMPDTNTSHQSQQEDCLAGLSSDSHQTHLRSCLGL
ncbi:hypothetical protein LIA77_08175 [Sarocladium implicatum]|nr:hypothetical protein LIA77_08175 [Sarocladium implicatum]